jgi:L-fuculose-phosphate aldolase
MNEAAARRDLVRYSRQMHAAGWVANHDGNLSARVGQDRIVCTPTAFSKLDVGPDDLVVCGTDGRQRSGAHKPFSELGLHRAVYDARPDVRAVVHAHPPFATAFGVSGRPVPHPFLPEAVVSLGAELPVVPLTAPGDAAVKALKPFVRRCDAVLMAGNGAFAWGPDLETAWLRLELVEHLCRIAHAALPLGGPALLPADLVADLLGKRAKAGLAAPEEGRKTPPADVATRAAQRAVAALPNVDPQLAARIAAEIAGRLS